MDYNPPVQSVGEIGQKIPDYQIRQQSIPTNHVKLQFSLINSSLFG